MNQDNQTPLLQLQYIYYYNTLMVYHAAVPIILNSSCLNLACKNLNQQGVALTGRNTTGPPRAAPW